MAKLLEGRDRIGTAKESICKERIYLSHRKYKGEHTLLPTSRGNGMLNQRESMTQVVVVINGMTELVMPVVWAWESKCPNSLDPPFSSPPLLLSTSIICK